MPTGVDVLVCDVNGDVPELGIEAGLKVAPAGSPATERPRSDVKPFDGVDVSEYWTLPPGVALADDGDAANGSPASRRRHLRRRQR